MSEYIEREALIQDAEDVLTFPMLDRINRQPAADVETVVHCGECEHRIFVEVVDVGQIGGCEIFGCAMQNSSFCSYGKRKEKNNECFIGN